MPKLIEESKKNLEIFSFIHGAQCVLSLSKQPVLFPEEKKNGKNLVEVTGTPGWSLEQSPQPLFSCPGSISFSHYLFLMIEWKHGEIIMVTTNGKMQPPAT